MDTNRLMQELNNHTEDNGNMSVFVTNDDGNLVPVDDVEVVTMRDPEGDYHVFVLKTRARKQERRT